MADRDVQSIINDWDDLIQQGLKYREDYGKSGDWKTYRDYGRNEFQGYSKDSNGILPYNIVYAHGHALIPKVYFRNPYINVSARARPGYNLNARVVEAVDNWMLYEMNMKQTMKQAVSDCFYTNRAFIKVGYDSIGSGTTKGKDLNDKIAEYLSTPVSQLGKKGDRHEYNVNVKPGMPWAVRVLADFIIVPFGVHSLEDCPWIDHVIIKPLADVKDDPKYINTQDLKGTHLWMCAKDSFKSQFYNEISAKTPLVEIHEIHDFKKKELKAYVPGYSKWIRKPQEDKLQIEGLPFVDFAFNMDSDYYWGPSDVRIMEPQQLEINETTTQVMHHRRLAMVKFLVEENGMDSTEVDKMLSDKVGPAAFTKGKPSESVTLLQPHIPQDLHMWTEAIRSNVRELFGQGRQQMGEAPSGRRTAAEMQMVQSASDVRMDERRDIVADALVKVVRKCNQQIFERWDVEKVAEVVGYDGARYWVKYNKHAVKGEYTLRVDVESMTPSTKQMKRRELVQLIQALGKNPRVNIDYLMRMLMQEYDYIDAMQVLPQAQETMNQPMGMDQFTQQQGKMLENPEVMNARTSQNAKQLAGA